MTKGSKMCFAWYPVSPLTVIAFKAPASSKDWKIYKGKTRQVGAEEDRRKKYNDTELRGKV